MKLWPSRDQAGLDDNGPSAPVLNPAQLIEIMQCFPIGSKLRYFIDGQQDLSGDSIVIAYGINNHLVYSQNDIRSHIDGQHHVFLLDDNWKDIIVRDVHSFSLLIPHIDVEDNQLSYPRKVEILNEVRFNRGQMISLMSLLNDRGVPHLQSHVRKRVVMKEGYYASHPVVVLDADVETLTLVDQRQQQRVRTSIPMVLAEETGRERLQCALVDFSESFVRLHVDPDAPLVQTLEVDQILVMTIELERQPHRFVVQGRLARIDNEFIVLEMLAMKQGDRFEPMRMLDVFEFKATLLQHPDTH